MVANTLPKGVREIGPFAFASLLRDEPSWCLLPGDGTASTKRPPHWPARGRGGRPHGLPEHPPGQRPRTRGAKPERSLAGRTARGHTLGLRRRPDAGARSGEPVPRRQPHSRGQILTIMSPIQRPRCSMSSSVHRSSDSSRSRRFKNRLSDFRIFSRFTLAVPQQTCRSEPRASSRRRHRPAISGRRARSADATRDHRRHPDTARRTSPGSGGGPRPPCTADSS